jgi:hypothetical protein
MAWHLETDTPTVVTFDIAEFYEKLLSHSDFHLDKTSLMKTL